MTDKLQRLRQLIADTPVDRRGRRHYDGKLRQEISSYATSRHADGESYRKIARALGLSDVNLWRWRDNGPSKSSSSGRPMGFRPVSLQAQGPASVTATSEIIAPAGPISRPIVVLPGGVRIEGLAVGDLAELVRSLGCLS